MVDWLDNDIKVHILDKKAEILKKEFNKKHKRPLDMWDLKVVNYLDKKLKKEAKEILNEQITIVSNSFKNERFK